MRENRGTQEELEREKGEGKNVNTVLMKFPKIKLKNMDKKGSFRGLKRGGEEI